MVEFPAPRPQPEYDRHEVMKHDLPRIIEKYTARGDFQTAAVYEDYLAGITGEHPTKLF